MLFTLGEIRSLLERSYALDPGFAYAGAPRLLGLIDHKLPRLLGGDPDRARRYFEEAIALDPDGPLNYQLYARLLEDQNRIEDALPVEFGPPIIVKPTWELRGEMLLAMNRPREAQAAFARSLAMQPGRLLSLEGLVVAARAAGDMEVATRAEGQLPPGVRQGGE